MKKESQIFRQSKKKNVMLFLISLIFVIIGFFMLKENSLMGWLEISLFGLGVIISLIHFHPDSSYLKLKNEGFEVKNLFRTHFIKWSEVKNFRSGHINGNEMIFFDYSDEVDSSYKCNS